MAKNQRTKRTPEEQAAFDERTQEIWQRIAECEAVDAAEAASKSA